MALDWKNIDWSELLRSQVMITSTVSIICIVATITGHAIPDESKSDLVKALTDLASVVALISTSWTIKARATAQPENMTVIVPKKDPSPPAQG